MKDEQIGNQMIVFDDFKLIFTNIILNSVRAEISPFCKLIESFRFVLSSLNDMAKLIATDIFE